MARWGMAGIAIWFAATSFGCAVGASPAVAPGRRIGIHRPGPRYYVIQARDTLYAIAQRNGTSVYEIRRLNPSVEDRYLVVGGRLRLPSPKPAVRKVRR